MPELKSFDYAIIRVVPQVEREEFINVGVILSCPKEHYLKAGIEVDVQRLSAFAPHLNLSVVRQHLEAISIVCRGGAEAGPIGCLPRRARFDWLVAPRSTIVQTSAAHSGLCFDAEIMLERLLASMVRQTSAEDLKLNKGGHFGKSTNK